MIDGQIEEKVTELAEWCCCKVRETTKQKHILKYLRKKYDGCDILRGVPLSIEKLYEHFKASPVHYILCIRDSAKNVFIMYYTVLP